MTQEHPVDCPRGEVHPLVGVDLSRFPLDSNDGQGSMRTAIIAAALFARERGVSLNRCSLQRLGRAATRAAADLSPDSDTQTLARTLVTDMAVQRVAALRLDDLDLGLPPGLTVHREDPDVAYLGMLGHFHSLGWEQDRETLKTIAYALGHEGISPALQQARSLVASAHKPLSLPLEAMLRRCVARAITAAPGTEDPMAQLRLPVH